MRSQLILPRKAGKGDHAKHGGRGLGGATRTASDKPPRRAPPPPRKCAVPLPRCAGADKRQRSRGAALRPSHANHHAQEKTKEGGGAPKDACAIHCPRCNRQHCCYRLRCGRAPNGARSPSGASPRTRHASRNQHWLSPGPCFPERGWCGVTRLRLSRLSALRADRSLCRPNGIQSRPGTGCKSARGHRIPLRVQACLENTTLK